MRKVLFLISHLGSGSTDLFDTLQACPRIDGYRTENIYDHPDKLFLLTSSVHKRDNAAAIYMDELLYNHSLTFKPLCNFCKFVFFVREPRGSLNQLVSEKIYNAERAARYYRYRLRGIYEYICRVRTAPVVTWDDLKAGNLKSVEEYLDMPLQIKAVKDTTLDVVPSQYINECQDAYERYLMQARKVSSPSFLS